MEKNAKNRRWMEKRRRIRRIHHTERIIKNRFESSKNGYYINGAYQNQSISEPHIKYGAFIPSITSYQSIALFPLSDNFAHFFADGILTTRYGHERYYYLQRKNNWAKPSNKLSKLKNRTYPGKAYDPKQKTKYILADLSFKEQLLDLD